MQPSLFDALVDDPRPPDQAARDFAVDPANDVVLEASAGTGKTRVLVDRYVRLVDAGVDPRHILAVTFTRKAAAEMRDRILTALRQSASTDSRLAERWRELRERIGDIQISTIDAFCFSLLREFPLEARVDPGFEIADETEMARFASEAMDLTLRAARGLIATDENVRLLFARVKLGPLRDAIQSLLDRRHVALPAVARFVAERVRFACAPEASEAFVQRLVNLLASSPHARAVLADGPVEAMEFRWILGDLQHLDAFPGRDPGRVQQLQRRLERYFLTGAGKPRAQVARRFAKDQFPSADAKRRHEAAVKAVAPAIAAELETLVSDVRGLLARGLQKVLAIAVDKYERLLEEHAVLDFAGMLEKAVALLSQQEEFARSRLKLQSRYHHVLVDEFQDTNRLQWQLVERLIDAWGEGEGAEDAPTSIFVVGDRKQSIYRFRHAEVTLLDEVARKISALRPGRTVRQAITHSFRAVPELLAFVNALSAEVLGADDLDERFTYGDRDRFPVPAIGPGARRDGSPVLGLVAEPSMDACARAVAAEVARLLDGGMVRDPRGTRPARPDDIAVLFRARTGHQFFEAALEARGIRTYVYKGLGFFDAPEVQDLQALLRYLAQPESNLRAAEFLRSRFVRISDVGLARIAASATLDPPGQRTGPAFAAALRAPDVDLSAIELDDDDRALLTHLRPSVARWLRLADRVSPSRLLDTILQESAYAFELRGRRLDQARENIKKVRALVRRIENRGYATLGRIAEYFETLRAGDESHAIVEAVGCVNLMTVHAAKGLEFPIVFVVNLHVAGRGRSSAFSVIERGPNGEPEVAFGPSEATKLEDLREREELRRLLYVSVTRARDRLYLAAEVDETRGRLQRGARSLAALLPASLGDLFNAATPGDEIDWTSASGTFAFRICRPDADFVEAAPLLAPVPVTREPDVTPVSGSSPVVAAATAADDIAPARPAGARPEPPSDRLLGTIVHRLFHRQLDANLPQAAIVGLVPLFLRPEESVDVTDLTALSDAVASTYCRLRQRDDVVQLLAQGTCHYEVPFSFRPAGAPGVVVRGRVDCLVARPNGSITVVEFKTGRPRPEHESQLKVYLAALNAAMPRRKVDGCVLYP
jgi:ATP-dependent helicase/nuclease subunit A